MSMKIYVGGLPYATSDAELTEMFSRYGTVESARVITDKFTGRSRGFGFVEMAASEEANAAITALNGTELDGRRLTVNEAKPQQRTGQSRGGFGGGQRGGGRDRGPRSRW